jgi:hypothetical protein
MPINFPNSPTTNQLYTYDNKTWQWNGVYWGVYSALTSYITSAYTAGDGYSNISGVTNGNLVLKSFSGVGLTITDTGNKLTFTSTGSYLPTSGGTITGNTIYTSGLTATTISANTLSLPFTTGSVVFQGSGGTLSQNNSNLFWNNANNRLGIGTASPTQMLHVSGGSAFVNGTIYFGDGSHYLTTDNSTYALLSSNRNLQLGRSGFAALTVASTNNILIGTTTDAGYKLDVNGDARVASNFYLNNFSRIISANNAIDFQSFRMVHNAYWNTLNSQYAYTFENGGGNANLITGTTGRMSLDSAFGPTAGNAVYNTFLISSTVNQTGGASGITRGVYINPTLTSAYDFRAIETTVGNVMLNTLSGNTLIGTTGNTGYKFNVFGTGSTGGINSNVGLNIQPVTAPIVTGVTYVLQSGSSLGVGTYYYRVTYYNSVGETSASDSITVITLSGSQVVQLNNIPTSTDTTVLGRKIYRSKLGDSSVYGALIGTISNNTGTTYTDSLPDSDPVFSGNILTRPIYAKANTTANYISVSGTRAMIADPSLTTFGVSAGAAITVAPAVTLFGAGAGLRITYGAGNTLFGLNAGANIVGGFQNVAMGEGAMSSGVVSGSYNVGLGPYVLSREGSFNIAMGYYAGNSLTGSRNVLIGGYIGSSTSSYNDAIIIGHNATPLSATSYQINIGNTIYGRTNTGNVMIGTTTDAGYKLDVNGTSAFRGVVTIFSEQEIRQDGITQTFTSNLGIFRFKSWSNSTLTAYLNGWNYEGYLNFALNIGTSSTANASAVLEVTSTTRGFLPPRMTSAQRDAISSPATGLTVYQTTDNYLSLFNGTNWQNIVSPNSTGNVILNGTSGNTIIGKTTDTGQKLQVSGNTLLQGGLTATTISATSVSTNFTTGSVIFQGSTGTLSQNNSNLFWDNSNSRLGININTPAQALEVWGTGYVSGRVGLGSSYPGVGTHLLVTGQLTGAVIAYGIRQAGYVQNDVTLYGVGFHNRLNKTGGSTLPTYYNFFTQGNGSISGTVTNQMGFAVGNDLTNATNNYAFHSELASASGVWNLYMNGSALNYLNGSLLIGTTTDAGYKLDVNGNVRVSTIYFNGVATTANIGATSSSLEFNTPTSFGVFNFNCSNGGRRVSINGTSSDTVGNDLLSIPFVVQNTTGTNRNFSMLNVNPTINNTASYTGIVRGLYYNPTITSLVGTTHRAIETTVGTVVLNSVSGNTLIGKTTDSGQKLQVSGNTLLQGSLTATTKTTIGSEGDISCALLQMASTTQGVLFPRMTNTQRTSISSPVAGLMVYCTDSPEGLFIYKSTGWVQII